MALNISATSGAWFSGVLVDALAKGQQLPMLLETLQWRLRPNLITIVAALGACGPDSVGGGKG